MTVRVKGLQEAIREIQKRGKQAERVVIEVLEDTATSIEIDAKQDAPYEIGGIVLGAKGTIQKELSNGGLTWRVGYLGTNFANRENDPIAWAEFGTGLSAKQILNSPLYSQEMRDQARFFFLTGEGRLVGTPHIFPNYIKHTANLVQELRDEIARQIK